MNEKIAILTDSCSDVPKEELEKYNIFMIPLKVIYKDREYYDGINITPQEVYEKMPGEIPSTSLPGGEKVSETFDKIREEGYTHVICTTLSTGLSGTNNLIRLISSEYEDLEISVIDTKNIALGAGFHAIVAAKYVKQGLDYKTIVEKIQENIVNSKIYFVVETLEYLQKGGRIGLVTSVLGTALNLKPIISCNDEGIYYTVTKTRGRLKSIEKVIDLALKFVGDSDKYTIAICHGNAEETALEVKKVMEEKASKFEEIYCGQISPCLGVHTGPGLIGIGIIKNY